MSDDRPTWFEIGDMIVDGLCRQDMLEKWSPSAVRDKGGTEDEICRPSDFTNLGKAPWKGNPEGERYMQCDNCLGQWGPDA